MTEPIDTWLRSGLRRIEVDLDFTRIKVRLFEYVHLVGIGYGATVAEATADALNDCMRRQEEDARRAEG